MLRHAIVLLPILPAIGTFADDPIYVRSHEITLSYVAGRDVPVDRAECWLTRDAGRNWQRIPATMLPTRDAVRVVAPEDGRYGFVLILHNGQGASAPPPELATPPQLTVVVDTQPPVLQLHGATAYVEGAGRVCELRVSLIEEHLSGAGLRVFYRTNKRGWQDGGILRRGDDVLYWKVPDSAGDTVDLRVIVTDLAGNRAMDEVAGVALPPPTTPHDPLATTKAPEVATAMEVRSDPVAPLDVKPLTDDPTSSESKADVTSADDLASVTALRRSAARHMQRGQWALAAARLEDALALTPDDAALLTDLGSAQYRTQRYEDAEQSFAEALASTPDHHGALQGLALVAATQRRYPDARQHLLQLLRLRPDAAQVWLQYGDVEHKLGDVTRAIDAWRRAQGLPEAESAVREQARRRLEYFAPGRAGATQ